MNYNDYKLIYRHIGNNKWYSFIKIFSLTVGLTSFILISVYLKFELSFDRFHNNYQNIYRVIAKTPESYMGKNQVAVTPSALALAMKNEIPEIIEAARVGDERVIIHLNEEIISERGFYYADPEFLQIFSFDLIRGDKNRILQNPFHIVLTQKAALKYFGSDDPIGKSLEIDNKTFTIEGIIEDPPANSQFQFNILASFVTINSIKGEGRDNTWNNWSYYTYTQLNSNTDPTVVEKKIQGLREKATERKGNQTLILQSIADTRLDTNANFELAPSTNPQLLYMLSAIGIFILTLAIFNYINLSTARATQRAKEIGLRKVVGASQSILIKQFLSESMVFVFLALFSSIALAFILLPSFGEFLNQPLSLKMILNPTIIGGLIITSILTGLLSGSYPAFLLASFKPISALYNQQSGASKGQVFRNLLIIFQFAISVALIFCSLTVSKQLRYINQKDLGYNKESVVAIRTYNHQGESLKAELKKNSNIIDITSSSHLPSSINSANYANWDGSENNKQLFYTLKIDDHFLDFYQIDLIQQKGDFSDVFYGDNYFLNESAIKTIGVSEGPIGQKFGFSEDQYGIIAGVVKDFHFASLRLNIEPLAISLIDKNKGLKSSWLSLKVNPANLTEAISSIESSWKEFFPKRIFSYSFIDDRLKRMYINDHRISNAFVVFTIIAIVIACLGLFGLASFSTERRMKEIGIRKVLGANIKGIIVLLILNFLKLIGLSIILALPMAFIAMSAWLKKFAFRINIGWDLYVLSIALAVFIAIFTVCFQSLKASITNPVDVLKYE